mgnify:FL=1
MARKRGKTRSTSSKIPTKVLERRARKLIALVARRRNLRDSAKHVPYHVLEARAHRMVNIVERRGGVV